jgi:hypothetical protein
VQGVDRLAFDQSYLSDERVAPVTNDEALSRETDLGFVNVTYKRFIGPKIVRGAVSDAVTAVMKNVIPQLRDQFT